MNVRPGQEGSTRFPWLTRQLTWQIYLKVMKTRYLSGTGWFVGHGSRHFTLLYLILVWDTVVPAVLQHPHPLQDKHSFISTVGCAPALRSSCQLEIGLAQGCPLLGMACLPKCTRIHTDAESKESKMRFKTSMIQELGTFTNRLAR